MQYKKDIIMKCRCSNSGAIRHTANGDIPVCISHNCEDIMDPQPDVMGRKARCFYCLKTAPSLIQLPYFVYRPEDITDIFYCGCKGWD